MVRQFVFQSWSIWTVSSKVFNLICVDENSKEKNVAWKRLMLYKNKNEKMYVYYCPHVDTCIRKYTYRFYNSMGDKRVPWPLWENTPYRPGHLTQSSSKWGRLFGRAGISAEFWRMHTCTYTYTQENRIVVACSPNEWGFSLSIWYLWKEWKTKVVPKIWIESHFFGARGIVWWPCWRVRSPHMLVLQNSA